MIKQTLLISGLLIIVGGFLLIWDSPPQAFMRKQTGQVDKVPVADSYMTEISSLKFSRTGKQQFVLTSPRAEFFTKKSELTLSQPNIVSSEINNNQLSLKAHMGILSNNGELVSLQRDVIAVKEAPQGQTVLNTEDLAYRPASNTATNSGPFKLNTPEVKLSGSGLDANFTNEIFIINSKVRAIHEPR
ncbi:MAG: LPS export ABC transporter periplasmic protein LptC [Porticoccaceae bacterium]